jgi:hypothetical protein
MEDREWTSVLIPSILYHCSKEFAREPPQGIELPAHVDQVAFDRR